MMAVREREFPLDPMELAAAEDTATVVLVRGGSGTGRTHTLAARVAFLLRRGAYPGSIVCLTLTDRGAEDLRRRLQIHPETAGMSRRVYVGTFHEYANDILRNVGSSAWGVPPDYTVWDQQRAAGVLVLTLSLRQRVANEILRWHGLNRARWPDSPEIPAAESHWRDVLGSYTSEKRRQNALDLDDLLVMAIDALERDEDIRRVWMPGHLLVDGFEDITALRFRLLEQLIGSLQPMTGPSRSLMVATDPNQRVTGGQDTGFSFTEYLRLEYSGRVQVRTHTLRLNQRGSQELWRMATTLSGHDSMDGLSPDGQVCDGVERGRPRLVEVEGTLINLDDHCLRDVCRLAGQGVPWSAMAILYRRGDAIRRLRTRLTHLDIPHRVLGEARPERAGDARCLAALLTSALNPRDLTAVRIAAAPGYPNSKRCLGDGVCRRLRQLAVDQKTDLIQAAARNLETFKTKKDGPVFQDLSCLVRAWHDLDDLLGAPEHGLAELVELAQASIRQAQPPGLAGAEEPELERLWALCDATPRLAGETPRQHLRRFLDLLSPALHAGRAPGGVGLTLGTIHAAKGLRWPIVFILDLSDRTIPGPAGPYSDTRQAQRVFYIGVTRATDRLYLYSPADTGRGAGNRSQPVPGPGARPAGPPVDRGAGTAAGGGMTASARGLDGAGKPARAGRNFFRNRCGPAACDGIDRYSRLYLWTRNVRRTPVRILTKRGAMYACTCGLRVQLGKTADGTAGDINAFMRELTSLLCISSEGSRQGPWGPIWWWPSGPGPTARLQLRRYGPV